MDGWMDRRVSHPINREDFAESARVSRRSKCRTAPSCSGSPQAKRLNRGRIEAHLMIATSRAATGRRIYRSPSPASIQPWTTQGINKLIKVSCLLRTVEVEWVVVGGVEWEAWHHAKPVKVLPCG